ncbi:metallophosphoesterase family protein [Natrarchaeobius oligotrophus]|uniref:Calcineurin-like phosphoesterase domain-containing protein n=1 Tax=Natrarchaeobius chitinivorans TaxID=1679083 RepID=A0A3N6MBH0_NATCH|nr:metallophosphoesterase [Natrarchaeobius chitinivorans]RQG99937.1 hypothetical protein EA472_11960 [Natrarchaeobius chitinivorans]
MGTGTADRGRESTVGPTIGRFLEPSASTRTRIAVVGDIHLSIDTHGTWKVLHRTERRLSTVIADCELDDLDGIIFAGDLTRSGSHREFESFDELVEPLEVPWVAIPGNHDVPPWDGRNPDGSLTRDEFAAAYADGSFPTVARFGGVDVVGLNTASTPDDRLSGWGGDVSDEQLAALDDRLSSLENPIVCCHHNLYPLAEQPEAEPWEWFSLDRPAALEAVLSNHDVPLVVSAHHHLPAATVRDDLRELIVPPVCSFPQAYCVLEIDERGTTARLVPLATPEETVEAYWHAATGDPLGRGVLEMASSRLERLPLVDERADDERPNCEERR